MPDLKATFRPLSQWPGKQTPAAARRRAPFRAGYATTLNDLSRELAHLNAKSVVIQVDLEPSQIRNDGWPRSSARPKYPGVVLSFQSQGKPLAFLCDTYDAWEDNLRGIALSLAALRAVDRYGVTRHAEQYRGFAQIEAPGAKAPMSRTEAVMFVASHSGMPWESIERDSSLSHRAYRLAAAKLHPDNRATGSHEQFLRLQEAGKVLG